QVAMPTVSLPGMHHSDATLDAVGAAADAMQPQDLQTLLEGSGFLGARERTWAGMRGPFARVVVRAWVFGSPDGAANFLTWLRDQPAELIGTAQPVAGTSLPGSIELAMHRPSGCCHEETPIYLASWQRGAVVWTIRASGPKIRTTPVVSLVTQVEQGV
ncbi:MAG: hypothetical protein ACXVWF_06715, partial [Actinomycetota bacterium]